MKFLALLVAIIIVVTGVSGAKFSSGVTIQGVGCSAIVNSDREWSSGQDVSTISQSYDYIDGASGHVMLTAPGTVTYQKFDAIDASINNRYNGTGYYSVDGGGIFGDTLAIDSFRPGVEPILCDQNDLTPSSSTAPGQNPLHQWADGGVIGIANHMTATTAKFTNDANYSLSQQSGVDGVGFVTGTIHAGVEAGSNYTEKNLNYRNSISEHFTAGANETGGFNARTDWNMVDFSDVFVTQSAENLTLLRNNTTVNQS